MKRNEDFRNALGQPDEYFRQSVMDTLQSLNTQAQQEDKQQKRILTRTVCAFAAAAVVCAGCILVRHRLSGLSDDQTDNVVQTTAVLALPSGRNTVETERATLTFDKAVKDGPRVLISVEARPKHEDCIALTTDFTLGNPDTDATVWEYYGIQPGEKDQTLYHWAKNHGCREALAVSFNSSRESAANSPFYGDYYVDDVRLAEDGSIRLTVAGEYMQDRDTYELEWMVIPLDMEDTAGFSVAAGTEHGSIQIGLDETQTGLSAEVPEEDLPAVKTELATLTFMKAEKDETGVVLTVKVQPEQEECIVCADKDRLFTALEVTRSFYGVQPAEPYQSMNRWIASHGYRKMLSVEVYPSGNGQVSTSVSSCRIRKSPVYEDGAAVMTVNIDPMPDADEMEMAFTATLWDVNDDGGQIGSDVTVRRSFRIDLSEEPEQTVTVTASANPYIAETGLATLTVTGTTVDGSDITLTVDVKPQHEQCAALTLHAFSGITGEYVWELYGIQPGEEDQSMYQWVKDHGYQEALAVEISGPKETLPDGTQENSSMIGKCLLREDGSAELTITDTIDPGSDTYELEWMVVPWNMEDPEGSFIPEQEEEGTLHIRLTE